MSLPKSNLTLESLGIQHLEQLTPYIGDSDELTRFLIGLDSSDSNLEHASHAGARMTMLTDHNTHNQYLVAGGMGDIDSSLLTDTPYTWNQGSIIVISIDALGLIPEQSFNQLSNATEILGGREIATLGIKVVNLGDIDDDDIDDLAVMESQCDCSHDRAYTARIFSGANLISPNSLQASDAELSIEFSPNGYNSLMLNKGSEGDIDNDGLNDLIFGEAADNEWRGKVWLFYSDNL
jgi:hypothetical protein